MNRHFLAALLTASSLSLSAAPTADLAIVLDTSGSMGGLITQVRDGLWKTLNSLGELKKDGQKAKVRLALYEYGSGVVPKEANFIQLLTPLTTDHTQLAQALFATEAKGGTEYSGVALKMATNDLKWTQMSEDFRSIVIAGNETIHQGPVNPLDSAKVALNNDILINTVFAGPQTHTVPTFGGGGFGGGTCGGFFCPPTNPNPQPPVDPQVNPIFLEWKQMAEAGGGAALNIDHNQSVPYIESPFDADIVKFTEKINTTFLPFGKKGQDEFQRMIDLDRDIRNSGAGTYMDWGNYRGGTFGRSTQATWDLVSLAIEAETDTEKDLEKTLLSLADEELPESLRGKTLAEKLSLVEDQVKARKAIQAKVAELQAKRAEFVEEELRNLNAQGEKTFSEAIKQILVDQLQAKGFTLK
ncbi:MAG: VWA domain-containing protein [Halobacteriovoraceae bacterium]|nr:VWA domain-containing protein [Halobacteriovoraceae bacterium]